MPLQEEFIDILCCPKKSCRGDLEQKKDESLTCVICSEEYEIRNGIPILFPNPKYSPFLHIRHWDKKENAESYTKKYDSYLKKEGAPWGLYTHESELYAVKRLTKNIDLTGKTILDCGSGNGRLLSAYPEAKQKIGIDTSLSLLEANKRREPSFWLVCGQLEDMPFKDAIADFSISIRVYQHLQSPKEAFEEMVRATKPSGYVALELYNKFNLKELYKRFRMLPFMQKISLWGLEYDRYYSYREIQTWAEKNFVKGLRFAGAGWGIHFYLFETLKFRHYAPEWLQRVVFNFFFAIEKMIGEWPFFSLTLEKITMIGSIQAKASYTVKDRAFFKLKNYFKNKKVRKIQALLENRNYAHVGNDQFHLERALHWLIHAQDATPDSGVSRAWSLVPSRKSNSLGWQPSYPETTGYIIPTFLEAGKFLGDELTRRANLMGMWELNLQMENGSVHGGNIAEPPAPAVFDTGQVIRGFIALFESTKNAKYLDAAEKAAKWILSQENEKSGHWNVNNALSVNQENTTYNMYAITPLITLGNILQNKEMIGAGERTAAYTVKMQNENGWFKGADFKKKDDALLHTIAYTIDGLFDAGILLNKKEYTEKAVKALDAVISKMHPNGNIPGRFNASWETTVSWSCLTGIAQIGVTAMKTWRRNGNKKYFDSAEKMKEFLKTVQNNSNPLLGGLGGVWGSWPISGEYGQYQQLNWVAKYFADLLLLFIVADNGEKK